MITLEKKRSVPENFFISENVLGKNSLQAYPHWLKSLSDGKCKLRKRFVAGTLVKTDHGYVAIEKIKVGDKVLSYDEKTKKLSYNKVMQTFIRKTDAIYKLTFEDKTTIETTWSHPFFIKDKEWVMAKNLKPGMRSMLAGDFSKRESQFAFASSNAASLTGSQDYRETGLGISKVEIIEGKETVYNFEVENAHTYFVTEDDVLVHNGQYVNPVNAYQNPGIIDGIGQRFSNAWNGKGFSTDEQIINNAAALDKAAGITNGMNRINALQDLGYPLSTNDYAILQNSKNSAIYPFEDSKTGVRARQLENGLYETQYGAIIPIKPEVGGDTFLAFSPPGTRSGDTHQGVDIRTRNCPNSQCELKANGPGTVVKVTRGEPNTCMKCDPPNPNPKSGLGNVVVIDHGGGLLSYHAHLSDIPSNIKAGVPIKVGDSIGTTGNSGNSQTPHYHYEVRSKGRPANPLTCNVQNRNNCN